MVNLKMQPCSPVLYLQIFITKNYSLFKIAASLFLKYSRKFHYRYSYKMYPYMEKRV